MKFVQYVLGEISIENFMPINYGNCKEKINKNDFKCATTVVISSQVIKCRGQGQCTIYTLRSTSNSDFIDCQSLCTSAKLKK